VRHLIPSVIGSFGLDRYMFDQSRRGASVDPKYNIVDIQMSSRYQPFDPFNRTQISEQCPISNISSRQTWLMC